MPKPTIIDHRRDFSQPLHHQALAETIERESKPKMTQEEKIAWVQKMFAPASDRMLVLVDDFSYKGSIIVPKSAQDKPTSGVVAKIGPEITKYVAGDHVIYPIFSGTALPLAQEFEVRVMSESEVLCKIIGEMQLEGQVP